MPFSIERNDLAKVSADVIVVTANEGLQINGGVGLSVARAAGLEEMQAACDALGGCPTGCAVSTPAFALSANRVVHVVGPVWQGGTQGEEALLRRAYDSALSCADACGARSIALPLISAQTFGFPVRLSFVIAIEAIKAFLQNHDDTEVRLVLFGEDAMAVGISFYDNIAEYIDAHYVEKMQAPNIAGQSIPYVDERPLQKPNFPARWEGAADKAAEPVRDSISWADDRPYRDPYSYERFNAAAPAETAPRASTRRGAAAPSAPKKRRGPFSIVGAVVEEARERLSDLKDSAKEKPRQGTCVVRDEERTRAEGPYLTPEQYEQVQEAAAQASWRAGVCPHCGGDVRDGLHFCPRCGRRVPDVQPAERFEAYGAAPAGQTAQFSSVALDEKTVSHDAEAPIEDSYIKASDYMSFDAMYSSEEAPSYSASLPAQAAPSAPAGPAGGSLTSWLDQLDAPFSTTLLALIDARGLTDAEVYKRANMSRQLFSKIRSDAAYRPTKKTVLALSVALGLDLGETVDLLQRAGFALSHSNKADIIVEYFIVNGNHDIFAINEALYAFDQPLL